MEREELERMIGNNVMNDKHSWGADSVVLVTVDKVVMHNVVMHKIVKMTTEVY